MKFVTAFLAAVVAGYLLSAPALADDGVFPEAAKAVIADYFGLGEPHPDAFDPRIGKSHGKGKGGKSASLPPGLAKRDALPPGLAKMETLPPGLAKRDLPPDLLGLLPPLPRGTKGQVVGDERVVLVEEASGRVLDILDGRITKNLRRGGGGYKEGGISDGTHKLPAAAGDDEAAETTSGGEEIYPDKFGRVKAKFPNEPTEEGDPDRPIITGTVPNPEGKAFDKSHRLDRGKKTKSTAGDEDDKEDER